MTDVELGFARGLDRSVWLPHYLPAWSSLAESAADWAIEDGALVLRLLPGEGVWCPRTHTTPLRVSGMQTGNRSGPAGSTDGQQPFLEAQRVEEQQEDFRGHLQAGGRIAIRCAMTLSPRSMAAMWLVGFEDRPERSAEVCVVEVFGREVADGVARVGVGTHPFRDPAVAEDFVKAPATIDVAQVHEYAATWSSDGARFEVDGVEVHRTAVAPAYPLQIMLAVFDFPEWGSDADAHLVPELRVERIRGSRGPDRAH